MFISVEENKKKYIYIYTYIYPFYIVNAG